MDSEPSRQRGLRRSGTLLVVALVLLPLYASAAGSGSDNGVHAVATFSPSANANGWHSGPVTVTLVCDSNARGCNIAYAVDGGASKPYTVPFQVSGDGAHTVVTTTHPNGNVGATTDTFTFKIDALAPSTSIATSCTMTQNACSSAITYSMSASDATSGLASTTCKIDEASVPCSGTTAIPEGPHTFTFKVIAADVAGNTASSTKTEPYSPAFRCEECQQASDTTPPTISSRDDVIAEAESSSGATVTYTPPTATDNVDTTVLVECSPRSGSLFALGTRVVECIAKDTAGNAASRTFRVLVRDTTAPPLATPQDPAPVQATSALGATVTFAAPTANDVVSGPVLATCTPASGTTFAIGSTAVGCTAIDAAGNAATATFTVRVVDTAAPTIDAHAAVVAEATGSTGAIVTYTAPATRDAVDGTGTASCAPASGSTFAIGATTVTCTATDARGNAATPTTFTLTVRDTTAPRITTSLAPATPDGTNGFYITAPNLTASATDEVGVAWFNVSKDGTSFTPFTSPFPYPEGSTTLTLRATDAAGNVATTALPARHVDLTRPNLTFLGDAGEVAGPGASVVLSFSEPMDKTSVESALSTPAGWTRTWDEAARNLTLTNLGLTFELQTISIDTRAKDAHGVALASPASHNVSRRAPPVIRPPSPPIALVAIGDDLTARLGWSEPENNNGAPVTGYRVYVDGARVAETTALRYVAGPFARGSVHTFEVTALNSAGGSAPASSSLAFAPISTISTPAPSPTGWHLAPPTVALGADPSTATILVDFGGGETEYEGPFTVFDGITTLRWRAVANGVSEEAHERVFLVDSSPPILAGASATVDGEIVTAFVRASDEVSGLGTVRALLSPIGGGSGVEFVLDPLGDGTFRGSVFAVPGAHLVTILASDVAGHQATAQAGMVTVAAPQPPEEPFVDLPDEFADAPIVRLESSSNDRAPEESTEPTPPASTQGDEGDPAPAPSGPTIVFDLPEGASALGAGARGTITIRLDGVDDLTGIFVVVVSELGEERILSEEQVETLWDTTQDADGYYTIEVRRRAAPPAPGELSIQSSHANGETLASARLLVRNPVSPVAVAAGAAVAGVMAAAATQAGLSAVSSGATSAAASAGGGFDPLGFAQEVAIDAGQDKLKAKTKDKAALDRKRRIRSWVAAVASLLVLAALWAFADVSGWSLSDWLIALPIVGAAAAVVTLLKYSAEAALAHATRAKPRIRLWVAGTISLVISSVIFRNPFGYPGYVDEQDESEARRTWRMQGIRGLATVAGALAFMLPFLAIATVAPWGFVATGLLIAITNAATTAMPFGPLPGRDVWRWSKWLAVGVAVAAFGLYVGFAVALVPVWSLWVIAIAGAGIYTATLVTFRRQFGAARTVRVPVQVPIPVRTAPESSEEAQEAERTQGTIKR